MKAKTAPAAFLLLIILAACTEREPLPIAEENAVPYISHHVTSAWPALALIETGTNPLWFELGPQGPVHIPSPEAASLTPYIPWPHARFVVGIMPWEGFLGIAVNLDGFLVVGPAGARTVLYRISAGDFWAPYTVGSFFMWGNQPAALLYRNDFFAGLYATSPQPQVFVLDTSSPVPLGADVPALRQFPPGESWEAETVRRGPSGYWYYRMREKGRPQNRSAYFRTRNLEREGEPISHGAWRNSGLPEGPENIPPLLSLILDNTALFALEETAPVFALRTLSTDFEGSRFFRSAAAGENMTRLYAFYRENLALVILPNGRGLYTRGNDVRPFALPALPQGFVYTGIALLDDIVLASWEEQQGVGIGAAGFMLRNAFY